MIGCPRLTYSRAIKKAVKRREETWPGLSFNMPNNLTALTDDGRERLRQKHAKEAHKHEIRMQILFTLYTLTGWHLHRTEDHGER